MTQQVDFRLPDIGEGITEGEIVEWFVAVGDRVREDDPMVEVMTDKATVTIGAPCEGEVAALHFDVGATAKVGEIILSIATAASTSRPPPARSAHQPSATAVGALEETLPGARLFQSPPGQPPAQNGGGNGGGLPRPPASAEKRVVRTSTEAPAAIQYFEGKPLATPATRRLAKELGVDLRRVRPTGPKGRVTQDDVRSMLRGDVTAQPGPPSLEERTPIVGLRRKIAERMHHAKATAAHFTFVEECDASRLVALRERLLPEAARRGTHLTYLPFVIKAVVQALQAHPILNSAVDEHANELVYRRYYNIGIATATEAGLMVPVVRHADRLRLLELSSEIERLSRLAREGGLPREELRGSTFTVTSLGKQGGLMATPILNHPEVGILGVHRIKEKPVVRKGQIVVGKVMLLSLSFDHRIVDGHVGAAFAYEIIDFLQEPERLFYEFL